MTQTGICLTTLMMTRMMQPDQKSGKRVLVGISGGVDSSVSAWLLKSAGYEVLGAYLITHAAARETVPDVERLCHQLGIAFLPLDVEEPFQKRVIDPFVDAWLSGDTPNPCVMCNPDFKFAMLLDQARKHDCAFIATGHYAAIEPIGESGRLALKRTAQGSKDQTYFLYRLTQEQLRHILFPLSSYSKDEVRSIAAKLKLIDESGLRLADKADSQDICFIPDKNYVELIRSEAARRSLQGAGQLLDPGPIKNTKGQLIGTHPGLIHFTYGQRKGFDVKTTERLFVLERNLQDKSLTVGNYSYVLQQTIRVSAMVYSGLDHFAAGEDVFARVRSSAQNAACRVFPMTDDGSSVEVCFNEPVAAPTPGQSCVFYRDGYLLAGGLICHNNVISA